jgi:hypothetical protein
LDDVISEEYKTPHTAECNSMIEPRSETIELN